MNKKIMKSISSCGLVFLMIHTGTLFACSHKPVGLLSDLNKVNKVEAYENYLKYAICGHNYEQANIWLNKAVELGEHRGQQVLAHRIFKFRMEEKYPEAIELLKKSANQGNEGASSELGRYYKEGTYVQQNTDEAIRWYKRSSFDGNADAMIEYSALIRSPENMAWLLLASSKIKVDSVMGRELKNKREKYLSKMTITEIQVSQNLYLKLSQEVKCVEDGITLCLKR